MAKDKKELLILKDGQMIYYYSSDGPTSEELMQNRLLTAGYLTAITSIVENSSKGNIISSMEMGNKHIFIQKGHFTPLIFVLVIHSNKIKEKKEQKKFELIINEFEELFNIDDIIGWNGNTRTFAKFDGRAQEFI